MDLELAAAAAAAAVKVELVDLVVLAEEVLLEFTLKQEIHQVLYKT
jgi:hypothetical protein